MGKVLTLLAICTIFELSFGIVTVHVIPHSHQDPGWGWTVEEYFNQKTRSIISTSVAALVVNPNRTMTISESIYLSKWLSEQNSEKIEQMKEMIQQGRFDVTFGGWVIPDESGTHYDDIILVLKIGHEFLKKNFNYTPQTAWSTDTFGHKTGAQMIYASAGYKGNMVGRVSLMEKAKRRQTKELEVVWYPSLENSGAQSELFSHILITEYPTPVSGLCMGFEWDCNDPPVTKENLPMKIGKLQAWVKNMTTMYRSRENYPLLLGDDFTFINATLTLDNFDIFMKETNKALEGKLKLIYSTSTNYIQKLKEENITWPTYTGDFTPYYDHSRAVWTGYFTSKPTLKRQVRITSQIYHAASKLLSLYTISEPSKIGLIEKLKNQLFFTEDRLSNNQHHDAIAGTSNKHVNDDFFNMLVNGSVEALEVASQLLDDSVKRIIGYSPAFQSCALTNESVSSCNLTQALPLLLAVFNPAQAGHQIITLIVPHPNVTVINEEGLELPVEVICQISYNVFTREPECELYFEADFKAMQTKYFFLDKSSTSKALQKIDIDPSTLENEYLKITLVNYTNVEVFKKKYSEKTNFDIDYRFYKHHNGEGEKPGHYIFRIKENKSFSVANSVKDTELFKGKIVQQLNIHFYGKLATRFRLINTDEQGFTIETIVPPFLPPKDMFLSIQPSFSNNEGEFQVDSNGLHMVNYKWKRDPYFDISTEIPSNYKSVTTAIAMRSSNSDDQLTILVDRPQGATVMPDGRFELMLQRRCASHDDKGIVEIHDELINGQPFVFKVSHYIQWTKRHLEVSQQRKQERLLNEPPLQFYGTLFENLERKHFDKIARVTLKTRVQTKWLDTLLPNVKINLFTNTKNEIVARLHNLHDVFDLGKDKFEINIKKVAEEIWHLANPWPRFNPFNVDVEELAITQMKTKAELEKDLIHWNNQTIEHNKNVNKSNEDIIYPLQFKTYRFIYNAAH